LTPEAQRKGLDPYKDSSKDFHSTCTADKAVGQLYGAAKKATLIPVIKAGDTLAEMVSSFEEIGKDLETHSDRRKLSVVSMSLVSELSSGGRLTRALTRAMAKIMSFDVPVVVTAGNYAEEPGRENIDTLPAILATRDYPLIVVGSCNANGVRSPFSQIGYELTTYAVGEEVTCFEKSRSNPVKENSGTSYGKSCQSIHG
jgi:hypothetical protein